MTKKNESKSIVNDPIRRSGIIYTLRNLFYIKDEIDERGTLESLIRGVEFRGFTLWTMIFAIFIASIGLNTNSTAVIIGAMLISPIMGPIMGAGLAMGINDFDLMKKSLRNLAIMTFISIGTSAIYFLISPLTEAQSELLARTNPTIYDVLIAVFGGATGIMAGARKDKISNAIPGVAIATALIPPLCTAGYGLANGNLRFFAGAVYLYMINSVFIGLSTYIFIKYLKFKKRQYVEKEKEKRIHIYMYLFLAVFILPSIYLAYSIVTEANFKKNAHKLIESNFIFENSRVLSAHISGNLIEVTIIGEPVSDEMEKHLKALLPQYGLENAKLRIIQPYEDLSRRQSAKDAVSLIQINTARSLEEKIRLLETELQTYRSKNKVIQHASREVSILFPDVDSLSFGDLAVSEMKDLTSYKRITLLVKWKKPVRSVEKKRLELFLRSRLETDNLEILEVK
jgi:uncharacterized hydrophobic protein (TIGR00271 family)